MHQTLSNSSDEEINHMKQNSLSTMVTGFENGNSVASTSQASVSVMFLLPIVNIHTKFHQNSPAVLETKYDYQTHRISPVCPFLCIS
jgi:hypothetical protein